MIADDERTSPSGALQRPVARTFAKALAPVLALLLTACSDGGTSDLREFVADAKQRKGKVEPLPEFAPVQTYVYAAVGLRDPFTSDTREMVAEAAARSSNGVAPDIRRRKEVLESYPLDSLSMLGTLEFQNATWGLVKAPDGVVHRVRTGSYMGQNYGKIKTIQEQRLLLTEIVPDGLGGWEEREASLAMNEQ
jgi:type IV pilus assembly protein PilP